MDAGKSQMKLTFRLRKSIDSKTELCQNLNNIFLDKTIYFFY